MLIVHRAETADALVGALAEAMAVAPEDPLATEVIVVPTRGIERWVSQSLATIPVGGRPAPGITANVDFRSPRRFFAQVLETVVGSDDHPWRRTKVTWSVLSVLDDFIDDPDFASIRAFVADPDAHIANRLVAADKIAGLFTRYIRESPAMIRSWARGEDTGPAELPLPEDHVWQSHLWRAVRADLGAASLAERIDEITSELANSPDRLSLPDRVFLYGFTAVPEGELRLLSAVAASRDVHLFVLHPSDTAWERLSGTDDEPRNPLLRSWGRDSDRLRGLLATMPVDLDRHYPTPPATGDTLLARLQARVRNDVADQDETPFVAGDVSVQVHACHGLSRQVDVARDAILHALAADPTLEPRDVVIMCPDVETFAPLIEAAFHPDIQDGIGIPDIRIRIADRAPAAANPLADLALRLVSLARTRMTASAVIEMFELEPVRRRFRLDDDAVASLVGLIDDARVSWGFDAEHRSDLGLADRPERTWHEALDRLAAGAFLSDRTVGTVGGVLPTSGLEGGDLEKVSLLFEILYRLDATCRAMATPGSPAVWQERVLGAVDALGLSDWDGSWQRPALAADLEDLFGAHAAATDMQLSVDEVEFLLEDLRRTRPSTANHRTGDLTVCTLVPMRSVPHRVVCLLGMDDGRFPRNPLFDGDDLLAGIDLAGARDTASEDRQLLLDALLAAAERLIVTFTGRDERTNAPVPPAVPIAELLEEINAAAPELEGVPASRAVTTRHPLQPFDPANFIAGGLAPAVWGFDRHMAAGAEALSAPHLAPVAESFGPPPPRPEVVELADLRTFLAHPVKFFVDKRLGFTMRDRSDPRDDRLPVELDGLGRWGVGDRLLSDAVAGIDPSATLAALGGSGLLPVGSLADAVVDGVAGEVDELLDLASEHGLGADAGKAVTIDLVLPDGIRLSGLVPRVTTLGLEQVQFSNCKPKHILAMYVDLLAVTAAEPERNAKAVLLTRGPTLVEMEAPADLEERRQWALERLGVLVDLLCRGLSEPIPLFCNTSHAFASGLRPWDVEKAWSDDYNFDKEYDDSHHVLAFGGALSYLEVAAFTVPDDEKAEGWPRGGNRFEVLARRLWSPIFAAYRRDEE